MVCQSTAPRRADPLGDPDQAIDVAFLSLCDGGLVVVLVRCGGSDWCGGGDGDAGDEAAYRVAVAVEARVIVVGQLVLVERGQQRGGAGGERGVRHRTGPHDGYRMAFLVACALVVAATALAATLLRRR